MIVLQASTASKQVAAAARQSAHTPHSLPRDTVVKLHVPKVLVLHVDDQQLQEWRGGGVSTPTHTSLDRRQAWPLRGRGAWHGVQGRGCCCCLAGWPHSNPSWMLLSGCLAMLTRNCVLLLLLPAWLATLAPSCMQERTSARQHGLADRTQVQEGAWQDVMCCRCLWLATHWPHSHTD